MRGRRTAGTPPGAASPPCFLVPTGRRVRSLCLWSFVAGRPAVMSYDVQAGPVSGGVRPARTSVRLLAWVLALACIAFAGVNVAFELTGRFEEGPLRDLAAGLSIANWFVAALKVMGAGVAVISVTRQSWMPPRMVNVLVWAAAGTLGVYSLGNVAQALGMAVGATGSSDQIDPAGIAYVLAFLLAGAGFVVLATWHSRRSHLGAGPALLGTFGGLVVLGTILFALRVALRLGNHPLRVTEVRLGGRGSPLPAARARRDQQRVRPRSARRVAWPRRRRGRPPGRIHLRGSRRGGWGRRPLRHPDVRLWLRRSGTASRPLTRRPPP